MLIKYIGGDALVARLCSSLVTPWTETGQAPLSHGISQARMLEWVAISFSRGSSQLRDRTQVSRIAGILYRLSHQGRAEEYVVTCKHTKHVLLLLIRIFMWTIFKVFIFAIFTILLCFMLWFLAMRHVGVYPLDQRSNSLPFL